MIINKKKNYQLKNTISIVKYLETIIVTKDPVISPKPVNLPKVYLFVQFCQNNFFFKSNWNDYIEIRINLL